MAYDKFPFSRELLRDIEILILIVPFLIGLFISLRVFSRRTNPNHIESCQFVQ